MIRGDRRKQLLPEAPEGAKKEARKQNSMEKVFSLCYAYGHLSGAPALYDSYLFRKAGI
jgi:hypothetical protein